MKFNYQFSNLCGSVYRGGNLIFTPDGSSVLSPVGNRISVFDLVNHRSSTLPFENLKDIARIALSPNGATLISIDIEGRALLINFYKRVVLCEFTFKKEVRDVKFSPDSKYIAVTHGRNVQVWIAPPLVTEFRPFTLHRTYTGHYDDVTCIEWSDDSQFFVTGSRDMTVRMYSLHSIPGFTPLILSGHKGHVVGCFFGQEQDPNLPPCSTLYTVSKDGAMYHWKFATWTDVPPNLPGAIKAEPGVTHDDTKETKKPADKSHAIHRKRKFAVNELMAQGDSVPYLARGRFQLEQRRYFDHNHSKVMSCALHRTRTINLMVVGYASGIFSLYELPDFNNIHTISVSSKKISTVAINNTGEWLAFGSAKLGQLLVWEWQSETYVLKQQGHFFDVNTLAYSPDGQLIATGGDDGKVKLWNTTSGFCFVTFSSHVAPVTCVEFSATGTVVLSASLDGTVRAHDLVRYRNFRTLTSPTPTQFMSLAIDPSGEVVCAGAMDPFEIYVWNLQTGRLLDILPGHLGPVSGLAFTGAQSLLASCSWDKTVRMWDPFTGKGLVETFTHQSDVLALAFRPDGRELCSAALDGQLYFWDTYDGTLKSNIEGKKDIQGGRRQDDPRAAKNSTHSLAFTSVCYSADGTCILAGGNSKFVCIYDIASKILIKKFVVTNNLSYDGVLNFLNSRRMTEAGASHEIDDEDSASDVEDRLDTYLPGAKRGDFSSRRTPLVARTKCVRFAPTGLQWAAASTQGLLLYSLDDSLTFDPSELDLDITPANTLKSLESKSYSRALTMALSLNEKPLMKRVIECTPASEVTLVVRSLPPHRLQRLLTFIAGLVDTSPHIEFYLSWTQTLLTIHGRHLKKISNQMLTTFRSLQKTLTRQHKDMAKICDDNQYLLNYLTSFTGHATAASLAAAANPTTATPTPAAPVAPAKAIETKAVATTSSAAVTTAPAKAASKAAAKSAAAAVASIPATIKSTASALASLEALQQREKKSSDDDDEENDDDNGEGEWHGLDGKGASPDFGDDGVPESDDDNDDNDSKTASKPTSADDSDNDDNDDDEDTKQPLEVKVIKGKTSGVVAPSKASTTAATAPGAVVSSHVHARGLGDDIDFAAAAAAAMDDTPAWKPPVFATKAKTPAVTPTAAPVASKAAVTVVASSKTAAKSSSSHTAVPTLAGKEAKKAVPSSAASASQPASGLAAALAALDSGEFDGDFDFGDDNDDDADDGSDDDNDNGGIVLRDTPTSAAASATAAPSKKGGKPAASTTTSAAPKAKASDDGSFGYLSSRPRKEARATKRKPAVAMATTSSSASTSPAAAAAPAKSAAKAKAKGKK